jgi:heme o synthase
LGERLKAYYWLTKPGIIYGNLITATAGFLLASRWHVNIELLVATLLGLGLVIASACVFNNVLDRGLDARMARTRRRALVTGQISPPAALIYATTLGLAGATLLAAFTSLLALTIALSGLVGYVVIYGVAKRRTVLGTLVGSLPGAVPPVVGYTAVTGHLDLAALILFAILVTWQMPHFYAIALYRLGDYTSAGLPVLPAKRGPAVSKRHILAYIIAFTLIAPLLTVLRYTSIVYFIIMLALGLAWLALGLTRLANTNDETWGRDMFRFSLVVLLGFSVTVAMTVR